LAGNLGQRYCRGEPNSPRKRLFILRDPTKVNGFRPQTSVFDDFRRRLGRIFQPRHVIQMMLSRCDRAQTATCDALASPPPRSSSGGIQFANTVYV